MLDTRLDLQHEPDTLVRQALRQLAGLRGDSLSWWPETVLLRESAALAPGEQTLTVVPGFIGAYLNALMRSTVAELPALARRIGTLRSEADYRALADLHAIRRTDSGFWAASDARMQAYREWGPAEAGLLDYGRLQNR